MNIEKIKEWWREQSSLKKGTFIGLFIGFLKIPFFLLFGEYTPMVVNNIFSKIPDETLCNWLGKGIGESCGFFVLYYGMVYNPIFYGLIGGLVGFAIGLYHGK